MTQHIRTLIVDDEPLARSRIRQLLEAERDVDVIGECANGIAAVEVIRSTAPDLVFLDVQMPGGGGFEVVERVGSEEMPMTVFVTAYDEFALQAFEAQALDYLLKPFEVERFRRTLQRVRAHFELRHQELSAPAGPTGPVGEATMSNGRAGCLERFHVRSGSRILFVEAERVDWIGAEGNYLRLHVGRQSHLIRETLSHLEARLDPRRFLRIHRSTIVNLERVRALETVLQREYLVILEDGTKLSSSSTYRARLERALLQGDG